VAEWDDAAFFDNMGVMRPRTGAVGVPNVGGIPQPAATQQRPVVTPSPPSAPVGRPASAPVAASPAPSQPFGDGPAGAPSELTMKFHPPAEPVMPESSAPLEHPLGTPVDVGGAPHMLLNPAGQQARAAAQVRAEALFGPHPFAGDPHAPKPLVVPGKPNFNPFLGAWS